MNEEWRSSFDESVLVGVVKNAVNFAAHLKGGFYHIPAKRLVPGWQEAKYVALYLPKWVSQEENGIVYYGKIERVEIKKRREIGEIPKSGDEEYVYFRVRYWERLDDVIRPVQYGVRVYMMTTLNTLKQAKELPEIFMKSGEEVTLWRMLRRISRSVKVELDARDVDQASRVERYRLKDLVVEVDHESEELRIKRNGVVKEIEMRELAERPSGVFRKIVGVMGDGKNN